MSDYTIAPLARQDLEAIWDYIAIRNENPTAARNLLARLSEKFALLATQPLLGQSRDDLRPGLRIFAAESYVVLYYPMKNGVEVVGVFHGAQDIEGILRRGER